MHGHRKFFFANLSCLVTIQPAIHEMILFKIMIKLCIDIVLVDVRDIDERMLPTKSDQNPPSFIYKILMKLFIMMPIISYMSIKVVFKLSVSLALRKKVFFPQLERHRKSDIFFLNLIETESQRQLYIVIAIKLLNQLACKQCL